MYRVVCFILLMSLEGLKAQTSGITARGYSTLNFTQSTLLVSSPTNEDENKAITTTMPTTIRNTKQPAMTSSPEQTGTSSEPDVCLFNLRTNKERALWLMIALLLLISLLLLVIIMCLTCKCCKGARKNKMVVMKSLKSTRRNSVNGGPSETDTMLKECSAVKVEMETTPDESREPEKVGGANAKMEIQVSTEENKNPANDTNQTTEEVDQCGETDLKMDDLEKAE